MPNNVDFDSLARAFGDAGCEHHLIPAGATDAPVDQLIVGITVPPHKQPLRLEICLLPDEVDPPTLQLFIQIEAKLQPAAYGDLARVILRINNELPLQGFGLKEDAGLVFFRNLLPVPGGGLAPDLVVDLAMQMGVSVAWFGELVARVGAGRVPHDRAVDKVDEILHRLAAVGAE